MERTEVIYTRQRLEEAKAARAEARELADQALENGWVDRVGADWAFIIVRKDEDSAE